MTTSVLPNKPCEAAFGFLPLAVSLRFAFGAARPLATLKDTNERLQVALDPQGFIYPPLYRRTRNQQPKKGEPKEGEGIYPGHLFKLPSSHSLTFTEHPFDGDFLKNDGAFLLSMIGFVYGIRLQFSDWWFDGRVSLKPMSDFCVTATKAEEFISAAWNQWRLWLPKDRKRFTNILYLQNRTSLYRWDWERFLMNYVIFDSLYATAHSAAGVTANRHAERLKAMCTYFGVKQDDPSFKEIVRLRNDLFHESFWDAGSPCTRCSDTAFQLVYDFERLNRRLTVGLTGFPTEYLKSSWHVAGVAAF